MSERAPKTNARQELIARSGLSYEDAINMSNVEVKDKLNQLKDVSDIVTMSSGERGHRPDGKFLSNHELEQVRSHAELIRDDQATAELMPATKVLKEAHLAFDEDVSIATPEGKMSRLAGRFRSLKNGLAMKVGNINAGISDFNFREKMSLKRSDHKEKGNRLRSAGYGLTAALGAVAATALILKVSRPLGVEAADAADSLAAMPELGLLNVDHDSSDDSAPELEQQANDAKHDYHFFDQEKGSPHDFGKSLDLESKQASIDDMRDRYKEDPALLAAHMANFDSNLDNGDINRLANELDKNPAFMDKSVDQLLDTQKRFSIRVEDIDQNYSSLYMTLGADGKPNVFQDQLVDHRGTMLVFTDKETGEEIKIRRECGGQVIQEHAFKDVPNAQETIIIPGNTSPQDKDRDDSFREEEIVEEDEEEIEEEKEKTKEEEITTTTTTTTQPEVVIVPPSETEVVETPPETETPPTETPPTETPPTETPPTETPPTETPPTETPPTETPPTETPPTETPPTETPPTETPPTETPPTETPPTETPEPKKPEEDINENPNLPPQVDLGDDPPVPSGPPQPKPADPPEVYVPPAPPEPEPTTPRPPVGSPPTPEAPTPPPAPEAPAPTPEAPGGEAENPF